MAKCADGVRVRKPNNVCDVKGRNNSACDEIKSGDDMTKSSAVGEWKRTGGEGNNKHAEKYRKRDRYHLAWVARDPISALNAFTNMLGQRQSQD